MKKLLDIGRSSLARIAHTSRRPRQLQRGLMALGLLAGLHLSAGSAQAATYTWNKTAAGPFNWADSANWNLTVGTANAFGYPNDVSDVADVTVDLTAAQTININAPITVGNINFDDTGATGDLAWTLASTGGNILTLDNGGAGTTSKIEARQVIGFNPSVTISAQLAGPSNVLYNHTQANSGTTRIISVINAANSYTGTTIVQNGFLQLGAASIPNGGASFLGNSTAAIILGNADTLASIGGGSGPNTGIMVQAVGNTTAQNYTFARNLDSSTTAAVAGRTNIRYQNGNSGGLGTLTISGNWLLGGAVDRNYGLTIERAGQTIDFTGIISGGATARVFRINDFGSGIGTARLSNASNSYLNQTTIIQGTLLIAGNAPATGSGVLGANGTLQLAEGGNTINPSSVFPTALIDGAFTVGKSIKLEQTSDGNLFTWTLGGNQAAASAFTGAVSTTSNANTRTLNLSQVAGGTVTFSGVIGANVNATNTTGVAKIGLGTAILSNIANAYDGATSADEGVLSFSTIANAGTNSTIGNPATNAAGGLLLGSGTLQYTGAAVSTNRLFTVQPGGGTIDTSTAAGGITFSTNGANPSTDSANNRTASTVSGSPTLLGVTPITSDSVVGQTVTGAGIPAGATIAAVVDSSTITLSANATGTTGSRNVTATTVGNPVVAVTAGTGTTFAIGQTVTGTGIPAGTTIIANSANNFTLSANPTASATSLTFTTSNISFGIANRTLTLRGPMSLAGSLSNSAGGGVLSVTKSGAGVLTLNGASTYTGVTTVSAGTLQLGASNRIGDSSNLLLAGGTFNTGGNSETLGTLALANSVASRLDLGSGASVVNFSGLGTGTGSLQVLGYTAGDQIFIGTTNALSAGQLAQIRFVNPNGIVGNFAASQETNGEIVPVIPATATTGAIISEFRFRGNTGTDDEYVEIANNTGASLNVSGWRLQYSTGTSASPVPALSPVLPANTILQPRGRLLFKGDGFTLAASTFTMPGDALDNSGVALLNANGDSVDAAGFASSPTPTILQTEGTPLAVAPTQNGQYAFVRRITAASPVDTGDNTADFLFVSITGGSFTAETGTITSILGAPGPENVGDPILRNAQVTVLPLQDGRSATLSPNRTRDTTPNTAMLTGGDAGTMRLRFRLRNNSTQTLSRIRFRITRLTTLNNTQGVAGAADMRVIDSGADETNVALFGGGSVPIVYGTSLLPPTAPGAGGGINHALSFDITLTTPLAPGDILPYSILLGVKTTGNYSLAYNIEAISNNP